MPEEQETIEEVVEEAAVQEQPVEQSESVDIDSLPDNIKNYITELREEAKDRRKTHEPYKDAFQYYNDAEKNYLLKVVEAVGTDQEVGAKAMKELAEHLLGETDAPKAEAQEEVRIPEAPEENELVAASEIDAIVQKEIRKDKMVQQVHEESRSLGFEPNTPECKVLWDIALTPALNGDLKKAAELARAYLGDKAPADPNAEVVLEQETLFPASATATGTGTVADIEGENPPPAIKSDAMRDKVLARLNAEVGE